MENGLDSTCYPSLQAPNATVIPGTMENWNFSNNTFITYVFDFGPKRDALSSVIPMTVAYVLILITGLIGNVCTCVVITRNKYMHTATNYYLFSLAISDLLLLVLGLPQELYVLWVKYPYAFGEAFCIIRGLTSEMSTNASILTITSFTMERYLAICHPLRAQAMSKLSRAIKFIIFVWIFGAICSIPLAIQFGIIYKEFNGEKFLETAECTLKHPLDHAFEISTFFFFILPMTVISVLYVLIGLQLRKSAEVNRRHPFAPGSANSSVNKQLLRISSSMDEHRTHGRISTQSLLSSRKAVIKMLVAVVVAFFICWAPFHAQRLLAIYVKQPTKTDVMVYTVLTYISGVTYYVSATINPILYSIMSLKFRQAFKDTLARCCGRQPVRSSKFTCTSHPNSTIRSNGPYDGTDFTLVSESPRHADILASKKRHENGKVVVATATRGQNETDFSIVKVRSTEDGEQSTVVKIKGEDQLDVKELSDYILKIKNLQR